MTKPRPSFRNSAPLSNLTPASEIVLFEELSRLTGGRCTVTLAECERHIRSKYPILGQVVEPHDIGKKLRKLEFVRDRKMPGVAWRHKRAPRP